MIGAGAGVAPFAFMEEREEQDNGGDTWLFFGERRRREDFYYQREWLARFQKAVWQMAAAAINTIVGGVFYRCANRLQFFIAAASFCNTGTANG